MAAAAGGESYMALVHVESAGRWVALRDKAFGRALPLLVVGMGTVPSFLTQPGPDAAVHWRPCLPSLLVTRQAMHKRRGSLVSATPTGTRQETSLLGSADNGMRRRKPPTPGSWVERKNGHLIGCQPLAFDDPQMALWWE